jgi:hypothetical protein
LYGITQDETKEYIKQISNIQRNYLIRDSLSPFGLTIHIIPNSELHDRLRDLYEVINYTAINESIIKKYFLLFISVELIERLHG